MKQDGKFILFTREEFKDYIMNLKVNHKFNHIQMHHTWSPSYKNCTSTNHIQLMKNMENYHIKNGMSEIAQHISTYKDGLLCIGRTFEKDGGGFKGKDNNGGITIENIGNFDINGDIMTEEQKKTIVFMTAVLCIKFNLVPNINTIKYHHYVSSKSCPGSIFFNGNTKESAQKYFYPLIQQEINKIKTIETIKEVIDMFKDEKDIPQWGKVSVEKITKLGLVKGSSENEFKPEANITKTELCVILDRLLTYLRK